MLESKGQECECEDYKKSLKQCKAQLDKQKGSGKFKMATEYGSD